MDVMVALKSRAVEMFLCHEGFILIRDISNLMKKVEWDVHTLVTAHLK